MIKALCIFGTRPEAIKMAPVALQLMSDPQFEAKICITGQHREMLDNILCFFGIRPDFNLDIMRQEQSLITLSSAILSGLSDVFGRYRPDIILVHGDTTTSFIAALAGFYAGIPVGHVEAGLRTGNILSPWPEEANRRLTASLSQIHFAPTETSRKNLLRELVLPDHIYVTGNTVIDALLLTTEKLGVERELALSFKKMFSFLNPQKRLILVTGHRRESLGNGIDQICRAIAMIASANNDVEIVCPVHPNPQIKYAVERNLSGIGNIYLIGPQDYLPFIYLMQRAHFIMTDSGGVQEEAPSLGKPVLLMRDVTERPEAVRAGTVKLVGTQSNGIMAAAQSLLDDDQLYLKMSRAHNPYGDGKASERIVEHLAGLELRRVNRHASSVAPQHNLG